MRQAVKILLASGLFILVVGGLVIYAMISKFNQDVGGIQQMQLERNNEVERINALPELHAVVVSGGRLRAPFSHVNVAAYALIQGQLVETSGPAGGRSSGPSSGPKYDYDDDVIFMASPDMLVSIDGTTFTSLPDSITLLWAPNDASGEQGEKFRSNHVSTLFDPQYAEDIRAVKALEGRSAVVNSYVVGRGHAGFRDILLEEVLFQVGDTIRFKGRIEGGRIVPLY
ncbi:MAG: hypothetical protein JNN32_08560 [Flavobacteriales bacterium]|nr:hypothetical protein [Flavobacteriales bacterium]